MTNPNIRAALEVAGEAVRVSLTQPVVSCLGQGVCDTMPCACAYDAAAAGCIAFLRALDRAAIAEQMRERDCHPDDGWNQILSLLVEDAVRHE